MNRSKNEYGCPLCGTKATVNFQEPRILNKATWSSHNGPDGTKCTNSNKKARVRHGWE